MQEQPIGKLIILTVKKINKSERNFDFLSFFCYNKRKIKWSVCDDMGYGGTLVVFYWYFNLFN